MEAIFQTICDLIDPLLAEKSKVLVAIDGSCTSGKTTVGTLLQAHYGCTVLHMDDFFLRPEQRTRQRLAQVGGNVDYERFQKEVLRPLCAGAPFSYRPYDCGRCALADPVAVQPGRLFIIEGSYSLHPFFGDPYDLKLVLTVSEQDQRERVLRRPIHLQQRFFREWIPMENAYLQQLYREAEARNIRIL